MPIDPITIGLFALIALMIFFMFRNSRKRRQEAEQLAEKMVPGVEVMTQHGIYGELVSVDEDTNEAIIETTPGTRLRVHRQTLARVVEPELEPVDDEADAVADDAVLDTEPEYGERTTAADAEVAPVDEPAAEPKPKRAPRRKPTE